MSKHTNGEWLRVGTTVYELNYRGSNYWSAQLQSAGNCSATTEELEANARLISAAPDMYEALGHFMDWMKASGWVDTPAAKQAEAALKKARGE